MLWDDRILADFQRGRIDLFYDRVYPPLLLYALRQLGTQHGLLAEDCVQDAVFQAWSRRDRFAGIGALKSFLYNTIRNSAINLHRKDSARERYFSYTGKHSAEDHILVADLEAQALIFNAIRELPDRLREIVELSFVEGLKNREIAERLGISLSSVNKFKAESLQILRRKIGSLSVILLCVGAFPPPPQV
ncbi:MAG: sigma-70 family RNA polymerase sigma factor [Rikenellaceae bacterium]|nr:sigma-70 family RNA polymerase sigma factor [Rikenellaceae bacterium]MCL2693303.1 sigma-70 family RNA polymerase sigma factor [Rikenellaceae bacterium]